MSARIAGIAVAETVAADCTGPGVAVPARRLVFIDNLRWSAISMVVVLHAAITYSGVGDWYWFDRLHTGRALVIALATYQSVQHSVAMGLLFGIAGYFAGSALDRRSIGNFLLERSRRLGLPLLLYVFVIGPLTEYYLAQSWHPRPSRDFGEEWLSHLSDGRLLSGSGPLWFCLVLLVFSCIYAAVARITPLPRTGDGVIPRPRAILAFVLAMTTLTFLVGAATPGLGSVLNVSVHDLPQYPLMFAAGVLAQRGDWLRRFPAAYGSAGLIGGLIIGLAYWFAMLSLGGAFSGNLAAFGGGWHWQSLAIDFWRSAMCLSLGIGLITLFRDHCNRQGRLARFLTRNAFGVYMFHPPILIAITVGLKQWPIENLMKFAIASVAAVVFSFLFVGLFARRVPLLRAIL